MSLVGVADPQALEYEEHQAAATGMLAKRFPRFDRDERLELYHEAWASVYEKRADGEQVEKLRAFLMESAWGHGMKRVEALGIASPVGPEDPALTAPTAADYSTEERVLIRDQARIARELINALEERQRALFKLRWDLQLDIAEVQAALGLSAKQYKRLAEEGAAAITKRVTELHDGTWTRRQRSLITACLVEVTLADGSTVGFASEHQRRELQRLLDSDPAVAAIYSDVHATLHHGVALLPLPTLLGSDAAGGRLSELAASIKGPVADLLAGGKQHATSAYVRAADPTPLAATRPGALAATITSCIALGGGAATYCVTQGIPDPLRAPLGLERPAKEPGTEPKVDAQEPPKTPTARATPPPATQPPTAAPKPPAATPTPAPAPAPKPTASPSEQQFGIEQPPRPPPAAPAPATPSGGGGGTSQFGIER